MPRPGEYTPQRRRIMQGVMLGILALTTALAAVVTRSASRAHRIELSPQTFRQDNVTVRMPLQWRASAGGGTGEKADPRVIAQAVEMSTDPSPRVVRVLQDRIDRPLSPLQYLHRRFGALGDVDEAMVRAMRDFPSNESHPIQIAGASGVLLAQHRIEVDEEQGYGVHHDVYAAVVLPSLQVIIVHQTGSGAFDVVDQDIVKQIAAGIEVADQAQAEPAGTVITLAPGIQLQPPPGFVAIQKSDTNQTDRLFWQQAPPKQPPEGEDFEDQWRCIEVVGCVLPSGQRERAAAVVQTLLLARDQRWRGAAVNEEGGLWRAEPVEQSSIRFNAQAYLLPDRSGRALLVVMSAGVNGVEDFRALWKRIEPTVKFLPASDIGQLESVGATEAQRLLNSANLSKLSGEREEQWWLFTGPGTWGRVGWATLAWQRGNKLAASLDTRMRNFGGDVITDTIADWSIREDGRQYTCETTRTENSVHDPHTLKQAVTLQRGQLTTGVRADTNAATEFKTPAPPQFIPGGVLPMLLGRLDPGPLLIRTDAFLDCDAVGAPEPLTVVIRPGVNSTRKAEGEDKPMRCVMAEVNGSGRVSRWYFRSNGELEVIELAGGVTMTPSTASAVKFAFDHSGPMAP